MLTLPDKPDPLGVLSSTLPVINQARSVSIDFQAVELLAQRISRNHFTPVGWDYQLHWSGDADETANFIFILDALNFCFWGEPRWIVSHEGQRYNGYWALAAALTRAMQQGVPLIEADFLASIDEPTLGNILAGEHTIPLLPQRVENLREAGRVLCDRYHGQFSHLIRQAQGSAINLVQRVVAEFPSFNDITTYQGHEVRFYKRAQILASDLAGSFGGRGLGFFNDLHQLTAFADYKVPQVLNQLNVIEYDDTLLRILDAQIEIPAGDPLEIEIRAATIWAIESLRQTLEQLDMPLASFELDWMLWQLGQDLQGDVRPYHHTRTIYY